MNPYRNRITAPGVRDNDWAHAPHDDMRFAAANARGAARWRIANPAPDIAGVRPVVVAPGAEAATPATE